MASINSEGAYDLQKAQDPEEELARLKKQASLIPQLEWNLLQLHGIQPHFHVLDAACGPGQTSVMMAQKMSPEARIQGIDRDASLLEEARALAASEQVHVDFQQADIHALPFESTFDFIYCRLVFQHLPDPKKAIQGLKKALKPGGRLLIVDIDDDWFFVEPPIPAFDQLISHGITYQRKQGGNRQIGKQLRNLLKAAGFSDIKTEVMPLNSDMVGMEAFLQIAIQFRKEILKASSDTIDPHALLNQIKLATSQQEHFGMLGVFHVSGQK